MSHSCPPCRSAAAPAPARLIAAAAAAPAAAAPASGSGSSNPTDAKTVGAIILGGGAGTRLYPLTKSRAKPAVPIGGAYRLIDVPMSNCINCGINKIYILTQFNSTSLNRHLSRTYNLSGSVMGNGFVEVLAATQTPDDKTWCAPCTACVPTPSVFYSASRRRVPAPMRDVRGSRSSRRTWCGWNRSCNCRCSTAGSGVARTDLLRTAHACRRVASRAGAE